jgi:hypothetical protein
MTNGEFLTDALRLCGVKSETDSLSAEEGVAGLRSMNDLFADWDAQGIDTGYFPQTDLQADSPIYSDALHACKYGLALILSVEYGIEPKPFVAQVAGASFTRILRDAIVAKQKEADMTHLPGYQTSWDIENG